MRQIILAGFKHIEHPERGFMFVGRVDFYGQAVRLAFRHAFQLRRLLTSLCIAGDIYQT